MDWKSWVFGHKKWLIAAGLLALLLLCIWGSVMAWEHFRPREPVFPEEVGKIPVHTALLPKDLPARPGTERKIKYVVIHETGNPSPGAWAVNHSNYLLNGKSGTTSWHYTVDDHEIYHHIPDNEVAWHAGDKLTEDGGNLCGIGVELCVNSDGDFEKTFENGAMLTAYLLKSYGLSVRSVKQHADFMQKNCPQNIRDNGRWEEFLSRVSYYMKHKDLLLQENPASGIE